MKGIFTTVLLILSLAAGLSCKVTTEGRHEKPMWIYVLAGQSNMAGRGLIEAEDTVSHPGVLYLDSTNQWALAREPLHYYEPARTGLDCGLSFAKEMLLLNQDSIRIGLIPCAVGGSSAEHWLYDSLYRGVRLYTNFERKVGIAKKDGEIKGILWHQGESNANAASLSSYSMILDSLFLKMRQTCGHADLPILMGELARFLSWNQFHGFHIPVNELLLKKTRESPHLFLVSSEDLESKGDSIHFNSASLRELGRRYARALMQQ